MRGGEGGRGVRRVVNGQEGRRFRFFSSSLHSSVSDLQRRRCAITIRLVTSVRARPPQRDSPCPFFPFLYDAATFVRLVDDLKLRGQSPTLERLSLPPGTVL